MPKINVLDKSVYNLISAGEVVENPASIVKELVENSIDAGADSITVSIENGGIKSITVTDNGGGMDADDLSLSVLPHATSKISSAADLDTIGTLGFRGEALASIASVSETTIKSRYLESDTASFIEVKGGVIQSKGVCGLNKGTQVDVKGLFFNTPARYKFLKSPSGEEKNVTRLMEELIFANPFTAFVYNVDGKTVFRTGGNGLEEAICAVYGAEVAAEMISFNLEAKGCRVSGFTARPATVAIRNNRLRQCFIVNGRAVNDATLSAVVQNAYGEFLMKRTFPTIIIDLIVPFDTVDVNVHPNKREVRFSDEKTVNGLVYNAVKRAVEEDAERMQAEIFETLRSRQTVAAPQNPVDLEAERIAEPPKSENFSFKASENYSFGTERRDYFEVAARKEAQNKFTLRDSSVINPIIRKSDLTDNAPKEFNVEEKSVPNYRVIGQLFDTYLLIEIEDEMIVIDQHAAHERLLYDKITAECKDNLAIQTMLLPYEYPVNGDEKALLFTNKDNLERLGFHVEFNAESVSVFTVPCILTGIDLGGFLGELIEYDKTLSEFASSEILKDKIAKIACKRAIKGGDKLGDEQVEKVLEYLFANGVPLQCPHGRPTMIKFTRDELEKRFGRKA